MGPGVGPSVALWELAEGLEGGALPSLKGGMTSASQVGMRERGRQSRCIMDGSLPGLQCVECSRSPFVGEGPSSGAQVSDAWPRGGSLKGHRGSGRVLCGAGGCKFLEHLV